MSALDIGAMVERLSRRRWLKCPRCGCREVRARGKTLSGPFACRQCPFEATDHRWFCGQSRWPRKWDGELVLHPERPILDRDDLDHGPAKVSVCPKCGRPRGWYSRFREEAFICCRCEGHRGPKVEKA